MRSVILLSVVVACAPRRPPPPPAPYEYSRELAELQDAIDDLGTTELPLDSQTPADQLRGAFNSACKAEHVSCDSATWQPSWTSKGDSGHNLAHALGDVDRVYSRWAASFNPHLTEATIAVESARREIREMLVLRERLALGAHLPEGRQALYLLEDLKYVRALIGHDPPPAEDPWDYRGTIRLLESSIATIEAAHIDQDKDKPRIETYVPDPADFAWMSYAARMRVAHDILEHAWDDYSHAGKVAALQTDRGDRLASPIHDVEANLSSSGPVKAVQD